LDQRLLHVKRLTVSLSTPTGDWPVLDDVLMAELSRLNLTTVAQAQEELARQSLATLTARMQGELTGDPVRRTVELELVVRGSTAVPRVVHRKAG
jgi:Periplasmic binding protein-like domain